MRKRRFWERLYSFPSSLNREHTFVKSSSCTGLNVSMLTCNVTKAIVTPLPKYHVVFNRKNTVNNEREKMREARLKRMGRGREEYGILFRRSNTSFVKWRPAVGAAALPPNTAYTVWYLSGFAKFVLIGEREREKKNYSSNEWMNARRREAKEE